MTNMKPMTYEEFTDLNNDGNLTDFVLYLVDRGVVSIEEHVKVFGNIQETVSEMLKDWLEVAKEELKERNEYIEKYSQDTCSICGEPIEEGRLRQNEDENIICEDCFMELQKDKKYLAQN